MRGRLRGSQIKTKVLFEAHKDDILISKMQAVHGAVGIVRPEHHGMKVSGSYVVLRPKHDASVTSAFFAWLTTLPEMYKAVLLASYGVHIEKMTFNLPWYSRTAITIPTSLREQQAIVTILDALEREERVLEALSEKLAIWKRAVVDKILSGEIPLPAS